MKFKKISLLSLLLVCGLSITACDGESNVGGTDNPDTPTEVEPPSGDDPDDTKTDDTGPSIEEPDTDGDGDDNNPDNPDTGGGGTGGNPDPAKTYSVYQAYSYVTTSGQIKTAGGTISSNGLTWTTTAATYSTYNKDHGVQIGAASTTGSGPQYDPWIISTDFGEDVKLASVTVYLYNANNAEASAHYEITFSGSSITSGDFTYNYDNVFLAQATDINLVGSTLSISLNAVTGYAFYLRGISLSLYTTTDSELNLSVDEGYEPPDYPDNPNVDPNPDTGGGGDGGDNPDTEPGPEEGGGGDGGDNPDDNPDPGTGGGGEEGKYPIAQSYSYALTNQDVKSGSSSGSSFTSNGLTWTYTFDEDNVSISSFDSNKGGHIGTSSKYTTEESPFVITCDFGETVYLDAITLYVGTGNNNAASLNVTFESVSFNTKSYVSTSDNPVIPVAYSDIALEGNVISIEMYSTSKNAIYLRAIAIDVHTADDTSLVLVNNPDYPTVDGNTEFDEPTIEDKIVEAPDNPDDYTTYNSYSHPWDSSEFEYVDDPDAIRTTTVGGLEWAYTMPATKIANSSNGRGITIGTQNNPQETYWTISTDFSGEIVRLEDCALYLYTATSGSGEYSVWFNGEELETDTFNTTGTLDSEVCIIELSDLNLWGGSLRIMLKTSTKTALYFKGITLNILTKEDSKLNLEFEDIFPPYEPHEIIPGEDGVKATAYDPEDVTADKFYKDVDLTLTGTDLQKEINEKCQPRTYYTYGDVRYMFPYTDEDPENEGYMYGIYDGDKMPAYWDSSRYDREHVWACSHMRLVIRNDDISDFRPTNTDKGHYSDIHNLRVCCKPVNTSKNDKYFGDVTDTNNFFANVTDPDSIGQGKHSLDGDRTGDHRGDGARCCLYMYCIYGIYNGEVGLKLEDNLINGDDQAYYSYGQLSTIVKWAIEDEPDEFEKQRNNRIAEYQGNRNPFIDYPDLVKQLFPDIVESLGL